MARLPTVGSDNGNWGSLLNEFLEVDHNSAGKNVYTSVGTGAVERTVETRLQEVISVKDFGAVGDGTTDDTTKIQAAINAGTNLGLSRDFIGNSVPQGSSPDIGAYESSINLMSSSPGSTSAPFCGNSAPTGIPPSLPGKWKLSIIKG